MKSKKFLLGMLVIVLAFGMTVIGCEKEEETEDPPIFFDYDITIKDIPVAKNGSNFTMSIIRDGKVKASETGTVADDKAVANLKITDMAPKSEITLNVFDQEVWIANIAIKIGSDAQIVKEEEFRKLPDDTDTHALVNGTRTLGYDDFE